MRARNTQQPAQNPAAASRKANPASTPTRTRATPSASTAKAISADVEKAAPMPWANRLAGRGPAARTRPDAV